MQSVATQSVKLGRVRAPSAERMKKGEKLWESRTLGGADGWDVILYSRARLCFTVL